ncbi:MAG: exodeoxyribonuclease V subunit beta [Methylosarcina sp.]
MESCYFSPANTGLAKGINLIEASAGTGKTYTIAMLVLRFVVELDVAIDQLLIVTFTRAATEELKDRIRQRLAEAKRAVAGHGEVAIDGNVLNWLKSLEMEPDLIRKRLERALLNIDQAGIFTIHGFCQRVLKEHALESGQLFDVALTDELALIKQSCADDFWRQQIYRRPRWEISVLTPVYKTPDDLLSSVERVAPHVCVYPEAEDLNAKLNELKEHASRAQPGIEEAVKILTARFAEGKFKPSYVESFAHCSSELQNWLHGCDIGTPSIESFECLSQNGLLAALNGNKFRSTNTHTSDERKAAYLAELAIDTAPFDSLHKTFKDITLTLRRALLEYLRLELDKRLTQSNALSFDNLISRLSDALQGGKGIRLIDELRQRFRAVLIDEFQDTDTSQWHIFSSLFAASDQYLYLIGDPKQAIYKFRGADIFAYLSAQSQAQHRFTLGQNWRSHPQLVQAVNSLFLRERVFLLKDVEFHEVNPGKTAEEGALHLAGRMIPPMMIWQLPQADTKNGYWTAGKAAEEISKAVVNEVVELLNGDYKLIPQGKKLQPGDIAILVRTNTQAREYQALLRAVAVPSVINSTESVFTTQEAADLYCLLQAVAHPGDISLLKQALTLDWFGLDGLALYRLGNDELLLDAWLSRFAGYFQDWQQKGMMSMMFRLLAHERVGPNLAKTAMAERQLTNLHHLIELVQQAAADNHLGIDKTLDWLSSAITGANRGMNSAENQQVRLECDDDAVQVITLHRSKGLEYPVVFCPCLWQRSEYLNRDTGLIQCHEQGRMIADLGSEQFESRRAQALTEELAEDIRISYVALTRAKYRCYMTWADVRSENSANASALAWLLEFDEAGFSDQQAKFESLRRTVPAAFDYQLIAVPGSLDRFYRKPNPPDSLQARIRKRSLYTPWQMSSYTALSSLSLHDAPEFPTDKSGETQVFFDRSVLSLPRGAHVGNVVHELLEKNPFAGLAQRQDISLQRDRACRRYGLKLEHPELLDDLLQAVVTTPLSYSDEAFCLLNLKESRCLKEMPFYLQMRTMDASYINPILQDTPTFQPLSSKTLRGYLTGFIDLICEYQGRYYVMDYKTNDLDDYSSQSLTEAMREHNYGLQYWLYTVVLHRYLLNRLPEYRFEKHFGGIYYLFVRGMQPWSAMSGVFRDKPELNRIQALAELFGS